MMFDLSSLKVMSFDAEVEEKIFRLKTAGNCTKKSDIDAKKLENSTLKFLLEVRNGLEFFDYFEISVSKSVELDKDN